MVAMMVVVMVMIVVVVVVVVIVFRLFPSQRPTSAFLLPDRKDRYPAVRQHSSRPGHHPRSSRAV